MSVFGLDTYQEFLIRKSNGAYIEFDSKLPSNDRTKPYEIRLVKYSPTPFPYASQSIFNTPQQNMLSLAPSSSTSLLWTPSTSSNFTSTFPPFFSNPSVEMGIIFSSKSLQLIIDKNSTNQVAGCLKTRAKKGSSSSAADAYEEIQDNYFILKNKPQIGNKY